MAASNAYLSYLLRETDVPGAKSLKLHSVTKMAGMLKLRKNRQSESTHSKFQLNKQKQKVMHSDKNTTAKWAEERQRQPITLFVYCLFTDVCVTSSRSRITMTLSAEISHFGCSETSVMSDLIQNICKTS